MTEQQTPAMSDLLATLETLHQAATPGPWTPQFLHGVGSSTLVRKPDQEGAMTGEFLAEFGKSISPSQTVKINCRFVADLRNHFPDLLNLIRQQEKQIAELTAERDDLSNRLTHAVYGGKSIAFDKQTPVACAPVGEGPFQGIVTKQTGHYHYEIQSKEGSLVAARVDKGKYTHAVVTEESDVQFCKDLWMAQKKQAAHAKKGTFAYIVELKRRVDQAHV